MYEINGAPSSIKICYKIINLDEEKKSILKVSMENFFARLLKNTSPVFVLVLILGFKWFSFM